MTMREAGFGRLATGGVFIIVQDVVRAVVLGLDAENFSIGYILQSGG